MVRMTRRKAAFGAAVTALALALSACGSDDDGEAAPDTDEESGEDADDDDVDSDDPLADQRVGAMDEWGVGDTFVATEPLTFGMLYRDHPGYPIEDDWLILSVLEEEHNVTFDRVDVPLSDWGDRRNLLLGAGDAPELVPSIYAGEEAQFVAGGGLLPVSDYLDYLPNFWDKVERWGLEPEIENLRQEDGKFYILPGLHELNNPQYSVVIRQDMFEEAGITEDPATWDELTEQLEVVAEHHGLQYAMTDGWDNVDAFDAMLSVAAPNFGTNAGWGFGDGSWYNGSEFEYTGATDGYRDLVTYFADLHERGLLDPESISQNQDQADQKFLTGEVAARATNYQNIVGLREDFAEIGNDDAVLRLIPVPAGPAGNLLPAGGGFESGIVITSDAAESDHFVALLQYVDWIYFSDSGLGFAKWGVEGETYTTEADGTRVLDPDIDWGGLNPGAPLALNADFGFYNGVWVPAHGSTAELFLSTQRDETVEFITAMNEKDQLPLPPPVALNELELERASLIRAALEDHVRQSTAQFIIGQRSLDEWDNYLSELDSQGMSTYIDIVNEAASRG